MNLDFHYYGTYVAARLAGYDLDSAQTIAHAAQYVDDSNKSMLSDSLGHPYISDFSPIPTGQSMWDMVDKDIFWSEEALNEIADIWVPFHFLPGNYGIEPSFNDIFRNLQRGKVLEPLIFMNSCYLISIDGTGYFSSNKIHCDSCCTKTNSRTGEITYQHQMLGAAIVHPDIKEVIPLTPEPIIKQDGESKNDSERNASKRFLKKLRKTHPHLHLIVTEDGLSSNAPHIHELKKHQMHYILGAKKGDHAFLFDYVESAAKDGLTTEIQYENEDVVHQFRFINQVPLNASNQDLLVNFVEYWETTPKKTLHFSWVTDIHVTKENVLKIMRGGRARWRIENETFNTLKNQGYHFEHNFGHGNKNLSVVFAMLMMLAFLVDQTQQLVCQLFQAVWGKLGSKRNLWEQMRALFYAYKFDSMEDIFKALFYGFKRKHLVILEDTPIS